MPSLPSQQLGLDADEDRVVASPSSPPILYSLTALCYLAVMSALRVPSECPSRASNR